MASSSADFTAITSPCTCTVDGVSGTADTRYNGYSFTGCGAHIGYHYQTQGAGYDVVWCYVTSPNNCTGDDPYVPEGFFTDNTLPSWEAAGAAWKKCYDGYRCEAWWGDLEGDIMGIPNMLGAPLDWPDCCALCSDTTANASCAGWSFTPSTGACQLFSTVEYQSASSGWSTNGSISGFPGHFEPPVKDCWSRGQYDLCLNASLGFFIGGMILAVPSCLVVSWFLFSYRRRWMNNLKSKFFQPGTCLVKVACVQINVTTTAKYTAKGGVLYHTTYSGTFATSDGAVVDLPRRNTYQWPSEKDMLHILFHTKALPLGSPSSTTPHELTPDSRRKRYASLNRKYGRIPLPRISGTRQESNTEDPRSRRYDCLLLVGPQRARPGSVLSRGRVTEGNNLAGRQVFLVGILGEDHITCFDLLPLTSHPVLGLFLGALLLILMCVVLLTNEAAQVMAPWTYPGTNYRHGAICGLVLATGYPIATLVIYYLGQRMSRRYLYNAFRPATTVLQL